MKKIFLLLLICLLTLSFCVSKTNSVNKTYDLAFVKEVYIDNGSEIQNGTYTPKHEEGEGKRIESYFGVFPSNNDTITIYKLNEDPTENPEKYSFWSRNKTKNSIVFYSSNDESIRITFKSGNNIDVDSDIYTVNKAYYNFLQQKIINEHSLLDAAFFLKDGYGDYFQTLEPLTKNWRNQQDNFKHKIISAKIKNKDEQTDNQFFEYEFKYQYDNQGKLVNISGGNRFTKDFDSEDEKYRIYKIMDGGNERSSSDEKVFFNKKTLFDSIVGSFEQYSLAKTSFFTKYQSELRTKVVDKKPNSIFEIIEKFK